MSKAKQKQPAKTGKGSRVPKFVNVPILSYHIAWRAAWQIWAVVGTEGELTADRRVAISEAAERVIKALDVEKDAKARRTLRGSIQRAMINGAMDLGASAAPASIRKVLAAHHADPALIPSVRFIQQHLRTLRAAAK